MSDTHERLQLVCNVDLVQMYLLWWHTFISTEPDRIETVGAE